LFSFTKRLITVGALAVVACIAYATPASADATGGAVGYPVSTQVRVEGNRLHVDKIKAWEERSSDCRVPAVYGHTEVYYKSGGTVHTIGNNSNHWLTCAVTGGIWQVLPNKNYPNNSEICSRFWTLENGRYSHDGSSCVGIHS
jgi:hypothetical protein